LYHM